MSKLKKIREDQNLTQEELSEKSGISVRTIQRVEAGTDPKGYTLKTLAKVLNISEFDLKTTIQPPEEIIEEIAIPTETFSNISKPRLKLINLSSIIFVLLPPLNIIAPLLMARIFKQNNDVSKQVISIQILWTILAPIVFFLGIFLKLGNNFTLILMIAIVLSNILIILINAYHLDKKGQLHIKLNFNIL